jgi:hypothetical protein
MEYITFMIVFFFRIDLKEKHTFVSYISRHSCVRQVISNDQSCRSLWSLWSLFIKRLLQLSRKDFPYDLNKVDFFTCNI